MEPIKLHKLAKRAGYTYWLYITNLGGSKVGNIISYDVYAGRELRIDDIQPYIYGEGNQYRVEGATHRLECTEIGNKIDLENMGTYPDPVERRYCWMFNKEL